MLRVIDLFDLSHSLAGDWLAGFEYPHEALPGIKALIVKLGERLDEEEYERRGEDIWVHKTAHVFPSALIGGPCIIGPQTEIRHGAFIRESALIGANCVVGTACELKNVILFDGVQVPHYNYVGDSILGFKAHLGAGAITSNVRADKQPVVIKADDIQLETKRKKVGAFLGDEAEVGCNAVLNPGTVLGRRASVYPTASVRGMVKADHICKIDGSQVRRV